MKNKPDLETSTAQIRAIRNETMKEQLTAFFNYKTRNYEYLSEFPSDRALEFLPQSAATQTYFDTLTNDMGMSKVDAFKRVLESHLNAVTPHFRPVPFGDTRQPNRISGIYPE